MVSDLMLIGPASSPAAAFLGSYVQVSNVSAFESTYLSSGGTLSDTNPIYKKNGSSSYLYKLPGGKQWAIGPSPGTKVLGATNEAFLSMPVLIGMAGWQVGNGSALLPVQGVYTMAQ